MNAPKILTWLDVRRIISSETRYGSQLPDGIVKIRCFSDALEVHLDSEQSQDNAKSALKKWFKGWYQEDLSVIHLTLGDAKLPVELSWEIEELHKTDIDIRPFWEEIAYLDSDMEVDSVTEKSVKLPEPYANKPNLIAFYSFKGGVGRTINLAAHLFALLDQAKGLENAVSVLVIDADLEAPGLTYWNSFEKQQPSVSFIDFLEVYHYSPIEKQEILSLFAQEVKKSYKYEGKSIVYFLPACINDEELLDTPILPEHLVRSPNGTWECGNAIHSLGQVLGVDYVFIDLRAGLSEISSPIIFDPRIQRFLVSTINEQSIRGTSLVLKQIGRVTPIEIGEENTYYDPSLIVTMLKPELKSLAAFSDALVKFQSAYIQPKEDNLYSTRLDIKETSFAEELLYVNHWEDARLKLRQTSVMQVAREWAKEQIHPVVITAISPESSKETDKFTKVRQLRDICQLYEYAEEGQGEDLLLTEPLKNLAINFRNELPHVVSIGAKGAGKTFNYIHLSRFKYWESFLKRIDNTASTLNSKTHLFPMLQSKNIKNNAKTVINEARKQVRDALGTKVPEFFPSEYESRIKKAVAEQTWSEPEWTEFWISEIARVIGVSLDSSIPNSLMAINNELKSKELSIVFLFDGLEDIFPNIAFNNSEKIALKALIDDLPNRLSEIRQSNLGLIIFLRRDFLRYTITQNLKQFENLYRSYDLSWDQDSFLRLVFWICNQAKVINAEKVNIESLSKEDLAEELQKLWGKRLGNDNAKEANTASWVFAALTDFNGRLQARDIVRFLYHAADITANRAKEVQFEKWSINRLLPPEATRRALKPCSEKKVEEAKEEYPAFKAWVEETLPKYPPEQRKIPFAVEQFEMEQQTVRMLEDMGVIYEDKEKEDTARFYMPEIFREGLGFSGKGARPRILVLKRKVLGKGIL